MAGFKDCVANDLNMFFNPDEFGELHTIDGVQLLAIVDDDQLKERQSKGEYGYEAVLLFYVSKSVLGTVPGIKQIMRFDEEIYRVLDVEDVAGLLTITLESNMS